MQLTRWMFASAHVLAGAAWFGAMLYSLMVLHPRARSFFGNPQKLEEFITHVAAGARWKVLSGMAVVAATGIGLLFLPGEQPASSGRMVCVYAKTVLFAIAVCLFGYTSWRLWPARTLASVEEIPKFQRTFRGVAVALLVLVGVCLALGVVSSHL